MLLPLRSEKTSFWAAVALVLLMAFAAGAEETADLPSLQIDRPDFLLEWTPDMPAAGKQVVVRLTSRTSLPEDSRLQWYLTGPGFSGASAGVQDPAEYCFTPGSAGEYGVTAELLDKTGHPIGVFTVDIPVV